MIWVEGERMDKRKGSKRGRKENAWNTIGRFYSILWTPP
jgi:hypothetical protein